MVSSMDAVYKFLELFTTPGFLGWFEIGIIAAILFFGWWLVRGTRGARSVQIFAGAIPLFILMPATKVFHLDVLNIILRNVYGYLVIAAIVIFHPEIRQMFVEMGRHLGGRRASTDRKVLDAIKGAILAMASSKTGAIIVLEQRVGTAEFQTMGIRMDAEVTEHLLRSIFYYGNPLHDGGVIISNNRIAAASCHFPLSQDPTLPSDFGTRHCAAAGMAELTDAIVFVVSEETGGITLFHESTRQRGLDEQSLDALLSSILDKKSNKPHHLFPGSRELPPDGEKETLP